MLPKEDIKTLRRLGRYALRYWPRILVGLLAMLVYAAAYSAPAYLTKILMDGALIKGSMDDLVIVAILTAGAGIVIGVSAFVKEYFRQQVVQRAVVDLRQEAGDYLLRLSMAYFDQKKVGDLISRLTNDIKAASLALNFFTADIVECPLVIAFALVAALYHSWQLTLICLLGLPLIWLLLVRFGRRIRKHSSKSLAQLAQVTESMQQMISGMRVVKSFGLEKQKAEEFRRENELFLKRVLKMVRNKAAGRALIEASYVLALAALIFLGGFVVMNNYWGLTVGGLAAFCTALATMYRPGKRLARAYTIVQESLPGCHRIFALLDEKPEIKDAPDAIELKEVRGEIVFEDVWFAYNGGEPVLRAASFHLQPGKVLGIVGPSGAGKSTILNLILRFYDPTRGRILIDGIDIRKIRRKSLLKHIAVVTQEPFLFNTTIAENIGYGRVDATFEEIVEAAKAANIHETIESLEHGYETVVGERGAKLSGGERQRITIARAILRNPTILLLDEATSNLDSESEKAVQEALSRLIRGRTCIIVAHRLSTVRDADRIMVVDNGMIVEQGTHEELMARNGLYRKLYDIQHRPEPVEAPE